MYPEGKVISFRLVFEITAPTESISLYSDPIPLITAMEIIRLPFSSFCIESKLESPKKKKHIKKKRIFFRLTK